MQRTSRNNHDWYLEQLVYNLKSIGEDIRDVEWIIKDGIWMPTPNYRVKFCDLILVSYSKKAVPIELKGSRLKEDKAHEQISNGKRFIEEVLNLECPYGKFVSYKDDRYYYKIVHF